MVGSTAYSYTRWVDSALDQLDPSAHEVAADQLRDTDVDVDSLRPMARLVIRLTWPPSWHRGGGNCRSSGIATRLGTPAKGA